MRNELADLVKGAWIQQQVDTLAGCQFAASMLRFDASLASAQLRALIQVMKPL